MEGYFLRGGDLILSRWHWLHGVQPISNRPEWGWGFHAMRGGIHQWDHRIRPQCAGVAYVLDYFLSRDVTLSFKGGADGMNSSQSAINQSGVGVSTPCGVVSPRWTTAFVLDLLKFHMY